MRIKKRSRHLIYIHQISSPPPNSPIDYRPYRYRSILRQKKQWPYITLIRRAAPAAALATLLVIILVLGPAIRTSDSLVADNIESESAIQPKVIPVSTANSKNSKNSAGSSTGAPQVLSDSAELTGSPAWTSLPLYVDPGNEASAYAAANSTDPNIKYIARMGRLPVAEWFGDWNSNVTSDVQTYVSAASAASSVPMLVLYNIPERDCGGYSTGGATSVTAYTNWMEQVATGIGNRTAVVVLEPDALGAVDCLASADQQSRYQALSQAVTILKKKPNTYVYIDAGTPVWQSTTTMAARLRAANVAAADGFSLNVSYFLPTSRNQSYGDQLSRLVGYKHYVIDISRNGGDHEVTGAVCNPSFAALGAAPTINTGDPLNDALLWIKIPWESDGPCNGSPAPGVPYWSYAVQLAKNAGW